MRTQRRANTPAISQQPQALLLLQLIMVAIRPQPRPQVQLAGRARMPCISRVRRSQVRLVRALLPGTPRILLHQHVAIRRRMRSTLRSSVTPPRT
ncbi:MAG: hypothetical protein WEE89_06230 [Gemmatimonadota bacterium]